MMYNVLIYPAGEINALEIKESLSSCVNIEVFGASSIPKHAPYVFKNFIELKPMIQEVNFIDELNDLIGKYNIDVIFPTHDTVSEFFSSNQSKINAKIVVATPETSQICRDKKKTMELFSGSDFCPQLITEKASVKHYPLFSKPRKGQGGQGVFLIENADQFDRVCNSDMIITEYLPGGELSVDCFTDRNGSLLSINPRTRLRTLAGISVESEVIKLTEEIEHIANIINSKLSFNGLWFFQVKQDRNGKYKLLEISTRAAGTMCLTRGKGINLPLLSVYNILGIEVTPINNDYSLKVDRALINRYKSDLEYERVYLDYDDTLIEGEKVNTNVIRFVYQLLNDNIPIVLITKHEGDLDKSLNEHHLSKSMFSEIIHLAKGQRKSEFINNKAAIFIDNAYSERAEVTESLNIPTFDVDAIEVLLDWKK